MAEAGFLKDLLVLLPDKDMEQCVKGALDRNSALEIARISCDIFVHRNRDPGCLREGAEFLRPFKSQYEHALVMFDYNGCGQEDHMPSELEQMVTKRLCDSGWGQRAEALIIVPELEAWVWSDSPHVAACLHWNNEKLGGLREWLIAENFLLPDKSKPKYPKAALEAALRATRTPRTSALYRALADSVSFARCTDTSFVRFKTLLQRWFGT